MNQYTHIERELAPQVESDKQPQSPVAVEHLIREQQKQIDKLQRDISRLNNTLNSVIARLQR